MDIKDVVLDDSGLLLDRLLRSLHRNKDGHLAADLRGHGLAVEESHNVATLYIYTMEDGAHMLHEHYVYSYEPRTYAEWFVIVLDEIHKLHTADNKTLLGCYGWITNYLQITPLRQGDLFIKIDAEGATGVRLSFDTATAKRKAHNEATKEATRNNRNRLR